MNEHMHANVKGWRPMRSQVCLYRRGLVRLQALVIGVFSFFFFFSREGSTAALKKREGVKGRQREWYDGTGQR